MPLDSYYAGYKEAGRDSGLPPIQDAIDKWKNPSRYIQRPVVPEELRRYMHAMEQRIAELERRAGIRRHD